MSRDLIFLEEGCAYFLAYFTDATFSTPIISTLIYQGRDSEHGHMFEEVTGENEGYICYPDETKLNVLNKKALIEWLASEHSQQSVLKEYDYKNI